MEKERWYREILKQLQEEYILKDSNFMNRMIDFDKSIFLYYKKYKNINKYFKNHSFIYYIFDIINLYQLKSFLKKNNYSKYINDYLNDNQEWYLNNFIPKNKNGKIIEIVLGTNKIIKGKLNGYGFTNTEVNSITYGWSVWVRRWRFLKEDNDRNVENLDLTTFKKKYKFKSK